MQYPYIFFLVMFLSDEPYSLEMHQHSIFGIGKCFPMYLATFVRRNQNSCYVKTLTLLRGQKNAWFPHFKILIWTSSLSSCNKSQVKTLKYTLAPLFFKPHLRKYLKNYTDIFKRFVGKSISNLGIVSLGVSVHACK